MSAFERPSHPSSTALPTAGVWGLGLVVAGLLVPAYQSTSTSSSGELTQSTETLVEVNGLGVVVVLTVPLLATVLVGCALLLRARRGVMPAAWALTALLVGFNVLAMLTIGVFVVPVTAALLVACASASGRRQV